MEKLKVYLCCSAILICLFLSGGLIDAALRDDSVIKTAATGEREHTIVIDPGHGGEDSGAVANGLLEKDINLSISLKLRDMLTADGYKVIMTRDTDRSIYDSSAGTTREKKRSDLNQRVEIINSDHDNILLSIHQNKFEQSRYSGTQIFYSGNDSSSIKLAEELRKSVVSLIQPDNKREIKKAEDSIFILKKAEVPAVIVECGFLSNKEEAGKLSDEKYQQQMAFSIYCGLVGYERKYTDTGNDR